MAMIGVWAPINRRSSRIDEPPSASGRVDIYENQVEALVAQHVLGRIERSRQLDTLPARQASHHRRLRVLLIVNDENG